MSDERAPRAPDVLEETASALESIDPTTEDLEAAMTEAGLFERASEATALLEDDPPAVLESLGLDELPDGSEPETIPAAIANGDEARVADLQALLTLASLAREDEADRADLDATLEKLTDAVSQGERSEETTDEGAGASADSEDDERGEGPLESVASAAEELIDSAGDAPVEDRLEAAVGSAIDGLDEEVRSVRDRLEALREDEGGGGGGERAAGGDEERDQGADGEGDRGVEGERETDDVDEGDDGSPLGGRSSTGRQGTMYSTVASSPADRPDMRHSTRHSTMPDRG